MAGVAAAFSPEAAVDSVLETMTKHSFYIVRREIELTMDLAYISDSVDEFAQDLRIRWSLCIICD